MTLKDIITKAKKVIMFILGWAVRLLIFSLIVFGIIKASQFFDLNLGLSEGYDICQVNGTVKDVRYNKTFDKCEMTLCTGLREKYQAFNMSQCYYELNEEG